MIASSCAAFSLLPLFSSSISHRTRTNSLVRLLSDYLVYDVLVSQQEGGERVEGLFPRFVVTSSRRHLLGCLLTLSFEYYIVYSSTVYSSIYSNVANFYCCCVLFYHHSSCTCTHSAQYCVLWCTVVVAH
jgi:hypothetical protein